MPFDRDECHVLASNAYHTHWYYRTTDPMAEVLSPGYFNDAYDLVRRGDLLTIHADMGDLMDDLWEPSCCLAMFSAVSRWNRTCSVRSMAELPRAGREPKQSYNPFHIKKRLPGAPAPKPAA